MTSSGRPNKLAKPPPPSNSSTSTTLLSTPKASVSPGLSEDSERASFFPRECYEPALECVQVLWLKASTLLGRLCGAGVQEHDQHFELESTPEKVGAKGPVDAARRNNNNGDGNGKSSSTEFRYTTTAGGVEVVTLRELSPVAPPPKPRSTETATTHGSKSSSYAKLEEPTTPKRAPRVARAFQPTTKEERVSGAPLERHQKHIQSFRKPVSSTRKGDRDRGQALISGPHVDSGAGAPPTMTAAEESDDDDVFHDTLEFPLSDDGE